MSVGSEIEEGTRLQPRFDAAGTIPCITVDAETGEVLMVAYMNREALDQTIRTGLATYYSRSRRKLWVKGEESGFVQRVQELRVDCDQDCLLLKVSVKGGASCHVGYRSCFYRRLKPGPSGDLEFVEAAKVFDPKKVYRQGS
ncbi:phosphoribosyl-AMP cyclohydrolase [Methylacidimicrobium sp. B4]|uniref:phosphoribosyl-AMP cyclohydrolase n=1 Tax=Methylacidimicrobium sp. B4 TaxID=2796139 RepID=UPI001A8E5DE5|nr:phosphoribosyl-AMP cyclohydrolase [Methylacidimicrobium sp. B4]QSR83950.1 phosphoribosyl-AMP cyclohydrolase [Methylacidimicrobium sp. B4]